MKLVSRCLLAFLAGAVALAQNPSGAVKPASRAVIEGIVTKDPGGEPVKKVLIELIAENQSEGGDYTAVTGADGGFRIEDILPGRYHLFVERTGLLESGKHGIRREGRVLNLAAGQELKDLQIRLQAAAVVRGRVTDEDGEPLPNAEVAVQRQTFISGHGRWEQVGAERTNDLGEYRIANLPAGNYYVSVTPAPDFKNLIEAAGVAAEPRNPEDKPATSYKTTYYPGTSDRSQATPIQLHAGDDFPVNFSLTPSPNLTIRGSVANLPPRSSASVWLQAHDANTQMNGTTIHSDGSFVIHDVAPGAYTILATVENTPVPMMARQPLQVLGSNVEGLHLVPQPGGRVHGRLHLAARSSADKMDPSQFSLELRSAEDDEALDAFFGEMGFATFTHVAPDGSFEWKGVPPGNYHVLLAGDASGAADWYLQALTAGGRDADSGIGVNGGVVALDLTASPNGAAVEGAVTDQKGEPVPNAAVVAVPEPRLRERLDRYRKAISDQAGRFTLHGLPPGEYTLFAGESVDGEAYYNAEFLKSYEGQGTVLHLNEADRKSIHVTAIPAPEDQN